MPTVPLPRDRMCISRYSDAVSKTCSSEEEETAKCTHN